MIISELEIFYFVFESFALVFAKTYIRHWSAIQTFNPFNHLFRCIKFVFAVAPSYQSRWKTVFFIQFLPCFPRFYSVKMNVILLMYKDKYFMAEKYKITRYDNLFDYIKFLYKKYSIKDLNDMFDYKQLQIQDFCESKKILR